MRGKERGNPGGQQLRGITPAYAGKSSRLCRRKSKTRDHPRVCGEKGRVRPAFLRTPGSPPRMRGKGVQRDCPLVGMGITPAYAGKSQNGKATPPHDWDHPRVCGEKCGSIAKCGSHLGSPPRMRGKERQAWPASAAMGITPAYAGKSSHSMFRRSFAGDHPRVCGEKTKKIP